MAQYSISPSPLLSPPLVSLWCCPCHVSLNYLCLYFLCSVYHSMRLTDLVCPYSLLIHSLFTFVNYNILLFLSTRGWNWIQFARRESKTALSHSMLLKALSWTHNLIIHLSFFPFAPSTTVYSPSFLPFWTAPHYTCQQHQLWNSKTAQCCQLLLKWYITVYLHSTVIQYACKVVTLIFASFFVIVCNTSFMCSVFGKYIKSVALTCCTHTGNSIIILYVHRTWSRMK